MTNKPKRKSPAKDKFDKYRYYRESVQCPKAEVSFFKKAYRQIRRSKPVVLTEDFCGTFDVSCHWVRSSQQHRAIGVDLDKEPIDYGSKHYLSKLSDEQRSRIRIINDNVLSPDLPKSDIVAALNFSYFIFRTRSEIKAYFKSAHDRLNDDGLFIIDCFGGRNCLEPNEEEVAHKDFSYFWDQVSFNPTNQFARFHIHFKRNGEKKRRKVFSYQWRLWGMAELRDVMQDVGFSETIVYWEGTDKDGDGTGRYHRTDTGEDLDAWVAYIVGVK